MPLLRSYKNAFLSLLFIVLAFVLLHPPFTNGPYLQLQKPYSLLIVVPTLYILGVLFAFRSKTLKESSWLGTSLAIIGLIVLAYVLFNDAMAIIMLGCGNAYGGC